MRQSIRFQGDKRRTIYQAIAGKRPARKPAVNHVAVSSSMRSSHFETPRETAQIAPAGLGALILAPFRPRIPAPVRDDVRLMQAERLREHLPQIALAVGASVVAATLALWGDLPPLQQFGPPFIILAACFMMVSRWRKSAPVVDISQADRIVRHAPWVAGALGAIAGFWCVSAFSETEKYYCVVAPVFLTLCSLMAANLMVSVPRAAMILVIASGLPIIVRLIAYDNLGMRAIAAMLVIIGFMQLRLIHSKFEETVRSMSLQAELQRLAETDPLTGLSNRRHMDAALNTALSSIETGVTLVAIDLDGFKPANDRFGHAAGDAILCEVAERLRIVFPGATCIARMGGDEFAVLITPQLPGSAVDHLEESLKAMLGLPYQFGDETIVVTASVGFGHGQSSVTEAMVVTRRADEGLYADKARKTARAPHTSAA